MYSIQKGMVFLRLAAAAFAVFIASNAPADAALTVSAKATKNVSCSNGVCSAVAKYAILNVTELQTMLSSSNVTLLSGSQAADIDIVGAVTWVSASRLTLNAYHSILIEKPISVAGSGALTLATNNGGSSGTYSLKATGRINFWSLASSFIIDGSSYTLIDNIAALSNDIAANPNGYYALTKNYDAASDGAYAYSPILTIFAGKFEGLGNTISNLTIRDTSPGENVGLFSIVDTNGAVANLHLTNLSISAAKLSNVGGLVALNRGALSGDSGTGRIVEHRGGQRTIGASSVGGLAGYSSGNVTRSHTGGVVAGGEANAGGLVGFNDGGTNEEGHIDTSFSSARVSGGYCAGGLVGCNEPGATIYEAFATGSVTGSALFGGNNGGLVGMNYDGDISSSYATGPVSSLASSPMTPNVGGFVGLNTGNYPTISASYSTGLVSGGSGSVVGGFVGYDNGRGINLSYWNTNSSGTTNGGCNSPDCIGLTTSQLRSGLPSGLNNSDWGQNAGINNGFPYLLQNPPQ